MLRRLHWVWITGLLVLTAVSVSCQQQTDESPVSAEQLYEQVRILWIARALQFTSEQSAQGIRLAQAINQEQQQLLTEAEKLWQEDQESLEKVLQSGIAGQRPSAQSMTTAQQAVTEFKRQQAQVDRLIANSIGQMVAALRPDQRGVIESREQHEQRQRLIAELEGADSVADYIVRCLASLRELTPDEYALVRVIEAQRLAGKIVDPRTPAFRPLVDRVLQLTDTVYAWPPEQYNAQVAGVAEQVALFLNLPPATIPPVSYEDLVTALSSPYTVGLLQQISAGAQLTAPVAGGSATKLAEHPVQALMEKLDIVALVNDLQMFPEQLARLGALAEQGLMATRKAEKTVQDKYQELNPTLQQGYQLLIASSEVPPEVSSALEILRETEQKARQDQRVELAGILRQVQIALTPGQNARIDWQPPGDAVPADAEQRVNQLRMLAAEMTRAIQFLGRLRYRDPMVYLQTRMGEVEAYLGAYVNPQSPLFPQRRAFVIGLLDKMKMVGEPDWRGAAPQLATELVVGVGAVPPLGGRQPTRRPLRWEDLYRVFSSPHTAELVKQMLQARVQAAAVGQ